MNNKKKDIAVYTAIYGEYDDLKIPVNLSLINQVDFYCFTDNTEIQSDFYQVIIFKRVHPDPVRSARYCKVMSHKILPNYKYTIWIDGNHQIKTNNIACFVNEHLKKYDIATLKHWERDCIYEEAKVCKINLNDNPASIDKQIEKYRLKKYPSHEGMVATGLILRKNLSSVTRKFNEIWWSEIKRGSRRDQLSFNYVKWKLKIDIEYIKGTYENNEFMQLVDHHKKTYPPYNYPSVWEKNINILYNRLKNLLPLELKRIVKPILIRTVTKHDSKKNKPELVKTTAINIEQERLKQLPRYTPTVTDFLGYKMEVADACTFLGGKEEIFDKGIYEFKADTDAPFIIDCGANIGLSVIYFKQLYPKAKIIAFEPDQHIFNALQMNVASFQLTDVTLLQEAIWKNDGEVEFKVEGGFSGRIPKPEDTMEVIKVKARRLKNLLNQPVDFLKIDIEGAEYEVLKDCADALIQVKNIFIEYHSHITEKQILNEIFSILTNNGFRYHIHEAYTHKKPYLDRELMLGMDLQLNIYGYRL